ncbi:hypothetical protein ACQ86E_31100 [Bradyrhizobium betae]|uniref:hypothetical protein n=1 Tax=Bradyrhizobium betae TaxID=244734 RepID=UPI003D66B3E8
MRFDQIVRGRSADFLSPKASRPIPHACGIVRDALVQATLDPEILEIDFIGTAGTEARPIDIQVITFRTIAGWRYLDIEVARPLRSLGDADAFDRELRARGLAPYTLKGADILKEPRFSTARAIWTYRRFSVAPDMRHRLLVALAEDGPTSLHHLCSSVPGPLDPFASVLSLACRNEVEIDISTPLSPSTTVSSRS